MRELLVYVAFNTATDGQRDRHTDTLPDHYATKDLSESQGDMQRVTREVTGLYVTENSIKFSPLTFYSQ